MPFSIVRNDITLMATDAIVNAANEGLRMGGGVCGAIFRAAGARQLQQACDEIGHCATGSAVATPGFALAARYVIHTPGPVWNGGGKGERELLASCYRSSLELAWELGCVSIAFPLISAGIYGYPRAEALEVAREEIRAFLDEHEMDVTLVLFDASSIELAGDLRLRVTRYIDDVYVDESGYQARREWEDGAPISVFDETATGANESVLAASAPAAAPVPAAAPQVVAKPDGARTRQSLTERLRKLLGHLDAGFSQTLLALIDERGLTDAQVYKRANISRQHFSKMRGNPNYRPTKTTVLALAVALELDGEATEMLLERAGFALSHADRRDVIVEFFINEGIYDVFQINEALFAFDQPLLG